MMVPIRATYRRTEKKGEPATLEKTVMAEIPDAVYEAFAVRAIAIQSGREEDVQAAYAALLAARKA